MAALTAPRPIWTRKNVFTETCPKSMITAQSLAWLEEFFVWRVLQSVSYEDLSAKKAEAFFTLEAEMVAERSDVQTDDVKKLPTSDSGRRRAFRS